MIKIRCIVERITYQNPENAGLRISDCCNADNYELLCDAKYPTKGTTGERVLLYSVKLIRYLLILI